MPQETLPPKLPRKPQKKIAKRAYEEAERRVEAARTANLSELNLSIPGLAKIPPLADLTAIRSLNLMNTRVSDLVPLAGLTALQALDLDGARVSDLTPLAGLTALQTLSLYNAKVSDLVPLVGLTALQTLHLDCTQVSDVAPLAGLTALRYLSLARTRVSDLAPLARLTALIDGAKGSAPGLTFESCPLSDRALLKFATLDDSERTIQTINYLREQQGLPPYLGNDSELKGRPLPPGVPNAIDGVPSPFDFAPTERGTISVAGSDTNIPAFPFATSREDHAQRLEACKILARDLIEALVGRTYDNARPEYLSYLQRYLERLPATADGGNMLLADGMARALSNLFATDAEMLPPGLASELHVLLEQHIAACVYYPEIGAFNRDVRDGKPSRPFPLQAARDFAKTVQEFTPRAFEPPVSDALSQAQSSSPPPPAPPPDMPPPTPQTIKPPAIPGGEVDPRKSREFATASTANRLWQTVQTAATLSGASTGIIAAGHALAPAAKEIIDWLSSVMNSLGSLG